VGALTSLIGGFFKPDLTKIEATHIVDSIQAQYLQPNLDAWRALSPEHKTVSAQAASLALVDYALAKVQQGCSNPALGTAGQHCISERLVRGGSAPWCPTVTGCDWYVLFRDPIANDPQVHPDPGILRRAGGSILSGQPISAGASRKRSAVSLRCGSALELLQRPCFWWVIDGTPIEFHGKRLRISRSSSRCGHNLESRARHLEAGHLAQ
jgi:hypothetical protein